MASKGLTEKMGLSVKPEGSAGTNYLGKTFQTETNQCKGLEVGL